MKRFVAIGFLCFLTFSIAVPCQAGPGFVRKLLKKKTVSQSDALRVAYILHSDDSKQSKLEAIVKHLKENKLVPENFTPDAKAEVNRGQVCALLYKAAGVKGGVTLRFFDSLMGGSVTERYAYRELVYLRVAAPGNQRRVVQGAELLDMWDKLERWRKNNADAKANRAANRKKAKAKKADKGKKDKDNGKSGEKEPEKSSEPEKSENSKKE